MHTQVVYLHNLFFNHGDSNMVDEVLKKIAENKIKELEIETRNLEEKLRIEESKNRWAWEQWGSELAGDFCDGELKIKKEINAINKKMSLLRGFISGGIDISQESCLRQKCEGFKKEIARLNSLNYDANSQIERISLLKELLTVTF